MFDVSFSELMVIAVIALLVIGPEKLPKVARTLGALTGRMQRFIVQVKEEVGREARFEELQQLQQEIKQSVAQETDALQASIHELSGLDKIKKTVKTTKPKSKKSAKSPIA